MVFLNVFQTYLQPSIEILNLRIDEPITTVTDLLFAAICFYAFFRIRRMEYTGRVKWYFKYYFLTLGFGALFGGIFGHAFLYRLSTGWQLVSWVCSLLAVALITHALVELSKPLMKPWFTRWVGRINLLILAFALFYTLWSLAFSPVKYYSIFGLVVVVGSLSYYIYQKTHKRGLTVLMLAVGIGFISALVFSFEWGLSPWFNHNDLSHVILSFSAFGMYKGASLILN
jgi:hypothetical protein